MSSYLIVASIIVLTLIVIAISNIIGNLALHLAKIPGKIHPEPLGFALWIGILFIIDAFMLPKGPSSVELFSVYLIFTIILIILGIRYFKITYSRYELAYLLFYIIVMIFISSHYTLGEQLGDNTFIFSLVTRNVNTNLINNFDPWTGALYDIPAVQTVKENLSFYHFFSFIIHYFSKLSFLITVPYYLYTYWVASLLFYTYSASLVLNLINHFKIKNILTLLSVILLSGFYVGTYYFNITLANFGITFLSLLVALVIQLFILYWDKPTIQMIIIISFASLSLFASGATGLVDGALLIAGFICVNLYHKDRNLFIQSLILPIGILFYANYLQDIIHLNLLLGTYVALQFTVLSLQLFYKTKNYQKYVVGLLTLLWLIIFISIINKVPDYWNQVSHFGDIKENFDRSIDYFSFYTIEKAIINLSLYTFIIGIFLYKKSNKISKLILLIVVFYMNPLFYPLYYPYLQWLYHRSYFVIFNITTISLGIISLLKLSNSYKHNSLVKIAIFLTSISLVINQAVINYPEYYKPNDDFNSLYKLNNQEVQVLSVLDEIINIEKLNNPRIISQIYGTNIYLNNIEHVYFTTPQRRAYSPYSEQQFENLYNVFYTPTNDGFDGYRSSADYSNVCNEVLSLQIDFIIIKKDLVYLDPVTGYYVPLYWTVKDCYQEVYENSIYKLYRIY